MKKIFILIYLSQLLYTISIFPQSQFQQFITYVNSLPDSISKSAAVDSFITYARTQGIPFIESNTANYFLRGPYNTVEISGDFNEFSPYLDLTQLYGTDFFYYSDQYELNARLDYEFRVNGSVILNDPENPDSILGYYGYNSELAMPDYIQPWEIDYNPSIQHGSVIDTSIVSSVVNRTYQLKIYLPSEYLSTTSNYPTVYFQDGFSYTDWGSSINVLDNLIAANKIEPIIAIFVNPTDRNQEYAFGLRNLYRQFFVNELVPLIDNEYRTINQAAKRLVMGDSYGGNISALISYNHPDVFGNCALQSAALHPNNYEVYNMLINGEVKHIRFSNIWGSYDDRDNELTVIRDSLISKGYQTDWLVLPEGHSWGLWRATVDTILQYFFPADIIPVELINFSAIVYGNIVKLMWSTATETNNIGFEIQRKSSLQGAWANIGFVAGSGTTTEPHSYNFTDQNLTSYSSIISYRLKQIDSNGSYKYSQIVTVSTNSLITEYKLFQNYPNPFNPATKIRFQIPKGSQVNISLYSLLGEEIKTLINDFREIDFYEIDLNASDLPSGIYFYRLQAGSFIQTKKMILTK